jgi:ABC-type nitrate/sulfonate/bicarbonate transport system substrate-binding protein
MTIIKRKEGQGVSIVKLRHTSVRLLVLVGTLAVAGALALAANVGAAPSARGAGSPIAGQRFILLAQSSPVVNKVVTAHAISILKSQGVDAQLKWNPTAPNVAIAQLLSGDVDVFSNAVAGGLAAVLAGIPIVDFALVQPRMDYVFIARPDIKSFADVKGKKVGVLDTVSINYAQALIALKKGGLSVGDVSIINTGGQSSRLAALVSGRVDATMLSHAAQLQLGPQGYNVLYDYTKQSPGLYDDNAFATKTWLAGHKDLAIAFNKALLQSFKWFNDPKNEQAVVQEALALAPGADAAATTQLFTMLRTLHAYPEGQTLNIPTLKYEQALFRQIGSITQTLPVGQWANVAYANAAKKALYPPKKK